MEIENEGTCTVVSRATKIRCTNPSADEWDKEIVDWVNEALVETGSDLQIDGTEVCADHINDLPEV